MSLPNLVSLLLFSIFSHITISPSLTIYEVGSNKSFKTISEAVNSLPNDIAGTGIHEIRIDEGLYNEEVKINHVTNSNVDEFVRITAADGHEHKGIPGQGVRVSTISKYGVIRGYSDFVHIKNIHIEQTGIGNSNRAVLISGSNWLIQNTLISTNGEIGLEFSPETNNNTIVNSGIYHDLNLGDNSGTGVYNFGGENNKAINTTVANYSGYGFNGVLAINCVVFPRPETENLNFSLLKPGSSHNASFDNSANVGDGNLTGLKPLHYFFEGATENNFHINPASLLAGAGTNVSSEFNIDIDGDFVSASQIPIGFDFVVPAKPTSPILVGPTRTFKTIRDALLFVPLDLAKLNQVFEIIIDAGIYNEQIVLNNFITSPTALLKFRAADGDEHHGIPGAGVKVISSEQFSTLRGNSSFIEIHNMEFEHTSKYQGISISGSNWKIVNCLFSSKANQGVLFNELSNHNTLINSLVHNSVIGVENRGGENNQVLNTTIHGNTSYGINGALTINTAVISSPGSIVSEFIHLKPGSGSNASTDHSANVGEGNQINLTDEKLCLVDVKNSNYHITSSSSLAGFGKNLSHVFTKDIDGESISDFPIGFDFVATPDVVIVDSTPPELFVPQDMVIETYGSNPITIKLAEATAVDLIDGQVLVSDTRPDLFPIGTTNILYTAEDIQGNVATALVKIKVVDINLPPLSNAGEDLTGHPPEIILLSGSGSTDPDGHYPLEFQWNLFSKPQGSGANISDPNKVSSSLNLDVIGTYLIELSVTDTLGEVSKADTLVINSTNTAPIADAGEDQAVFVLGEQIKLDGSQSSDVDGDKLTFKWISLSSPEGSKVLLENSTSEAPYFTPTEYGSYTFGLTVSDGLTPSTQDEIVISTENLPPIAVAGENQIASLEETVYLNGKKSYDPNHDYLYYHYQITAKPCGSKALLKDPNSATPSFLPDVIGEYVISLNVRDEQYTSEVSILTVRVSLKQNTISKFIKEEIIYSLNNMPHSNFKKSMKKKKLTNLYARTISIIDKGKLWKAKKILKHEQKHLNGCDRNGVADKNDDIVTCPEQTYIQDLTHYVIKMLASTKIKHGHQKNNCREKIKKKRKRKQKKRKRIFSFKQR